MAPATVKHSVQDEISGCISPIRNRQQILVFKEARTKSQPATCCHALLRSRNVLDQLFSASAPPASESGEGQHRRSVMHVVVLPNAADTHDH